MLNILCEEKIPFALGAFSGLGNVTLCKGNRLTSEDLKFVDVLIIRSGTRVDADLLEGTPVQFVATATAGTDHIDKQYLLQCGIPFYNAPGCNAESVVEYVIAGLFNLSHARKTSFWKKTVGIVGGGNVGGMLANRLAAFGCDVLLNDPPLLAHDASVADNWQMVELDELLCNADIVSLHVPLVKDGPYPTHHLIGARELKMMKPEAWLINAARGAVVSNADLLHSLQNRPLGAVILDVWENEPGINTALYEYIDIGTPHIAGHSYEGKVNGTIQVYEALTRYLNQSGGWDIESVLRPGPEDRLELSMSFQGLDTIPGVHALVKQMYDIEVDDQRFRPVIPMSSAEGMAFFLNSRKDYPRRRSFQMHNLHVSGGLPESTRQILKYGLALKKIISD